jgi:hypothetical protein
MARCIGRTSKKAWNNPLAPRAQCTKDALPGRDYCKTHDPEEKAKRYDKKSAEADIRRSEEQARWAKAEDLQRKHNEGRSDLEDVAKEIEAEILNIGKAMGIGGGTNREVMDATLREEDRTIPSLILFRLLDALDKIRA